MDDTTDVNTQVSATVRSLLAYRQTSPEVVMHAVGMSRATWQRRLKGQRDWTAAEVSALASFFGVPVQLLYAGPQEYGSGSTMVRSSPPWLGESRDARCRDLISV